MYHDILHNFFVTGILFAAIGIIFTLIAQKCQFFCLKQLPLAPIRLRYPLWGFVGYLVIFFFAAPLGVRFIGSALKEFIRYSPALLLTVLQILSICFVVVYLLLYSFLQNRETIKRVWIHPERRRFQCIAEDFGLGMLTWIIAFPSVVFVSQLVEFVTYLFTGIMGIEQVAIEYLKMAAESPFLLAIALIVILIAAPVIEEFVFRGLLFTYLKEKLGFKFALILSSLIFAFFHFAPSQGISNFALISSLFVFALYLGFLYERQSSLFAPIALHMTFNSISVMRIVLFSS